MIQKVVTSSKIQQVLLTRYSRYYKQDTIILLGTMKTAVLTNINLVLHLLTDCI